MSNPCPRLEEDEEDDVVFLEEVIKKQPEQKYQIPTTTEETLNSTNIVNEHDLPTPSINTLAAQVSTTVAENTAPLSPWENDDVQRNKNNNLIPDSIIPDTTTETPKSNTSPPTPPVESPLKSTSSDETESKLFNSIGSQVRTIPKDEPFEPTDGLVLVSVDNVIIPRKRYEGKKPIFARIELAQLIQSDLKKIQKIKKLPLTKDGPDEDQDAPKSRYSPLRIRLPKPSPLPEPRPSTCHSSSTNYSKVPKRKRPNDPVVSRGGPEEEGSPTISRERGFQKKRRVSVRSTEGSPPVMDDHQRQFNIRRVENLSPSRHRGRGGESPGINRERESRRRVKQERERFSTHHVSSSRSRSRGNSDEDEYFVKMRNRGENYKGSEDRFSYSGGPNRRQTCVLHVNWVRDGGLPHSTDRFYMKKLVGQLYGYFNGLSRESNLAYIKMYAEYPRSAWLIYDSLDSAIMAREKIQRLPQTAQHFGFFCKEQGKRLEVPYRVEYSNKTNFRD